MTHTPGGVGRAVGERPRARCRSAQQSGDVRSGGGTLHRLLTVRQVNLHVHLLIARFGSIMKTYRHRNGERFERERNDRASVSGRSPRAAKR